MHRHITTAITAVEARHSASSAMPARNRRDAGGVPLPVLAATADAASLANTRSTERAAATSVVMLATTSHAAYSDPTAAVYADAL